MKIELAIFDMAGTTVRDNDAVNLCLQRALAEHKVEVTRDEVNAVMGMAKPRAIGLLIEMKRGECARKDEVDAIHQHFLTSMVRFYETDPGVSEIPGAERLFRRLKAAGIKVALDTGFSRTILNSILQRLNWTGRDVLDATVASDEVIHGRPMPDLVVEAMRRTGVLDAAKVAKIGDTPSDLGEGTAAGCRLVIGVTYGSHTRQQLQAHPHTHLVDALDDIAGVLLP